MGPEATLLLMRRVLETVDATDDADHIPLIVHQNPQVPSRIAHLIEGHGDSPVAALVAMARALERAGAAALAMPCNTSHAYLDAIRAATDLPFLDMVALSVDALPEGTTVGVLASPATVAACVFDDAFARRDVTPRHADGEAALALIRRVKAEGATAGSVHDLGRLADQIGEVDHLLVGCTEFSLLTHALPPGTWTDGMDILAAEITRFATGG